MEIFCTLALMKVQDMLKASLILFLLVTTYISRMTWHIELTVGGGGQFAFF